MKIQICALMTIALIGSGVAEAQEPAPRKLRVLLITDGPTREFQFVREALLREAKKNGQELAVFMQPKDKAAEAVKERVEGMRVLTELPDRASAGKEKGPSLSDYDVVIAFDPNWAALSAKQHTAVKEWVSKHGGGLVFVAGHVNTHQLRQRSGGEFADVTSILPVTVKDGRLHGIGLGQGLSKDKGPYAIKFAPDTKFKLDTKGKHPMAGWNGFFWDDEKFKPEPGKDAKPKRGFFTYYPVDRLLEGGDVIATFENLNEYRMTNGKPVPFLVGRRVGNGQTLYLGSAETWRLRAYNEEHFDKLWLTMVQYVATPQADAPKKETPR